ncbi:MAG: hypothetical protein KJO26_09030 [Deltaproteobacteria bacterium]|nr:hypothetical protein [Deltaproteobacteria bacterium]NNK86568.1 hypothetical protein [Desulfobacterales bacterium]
MPIIMVENQYPVSKNREVLAAWLSGLEKYPRPEGLFTPLIETAVSSNLDGLRVLSAYLVNPGKYEEAAAYFQKFMTTFFDIEGYAYQFSNWSTIEEAMESIGEKPPER